MKKNFIENRLILQISPNELLSKAFSFRGLSRNTIASLSLAAEVELKAKGFNRSRSSDDVRDLSGVGSIRAQSDNLTYQQVTLENSLTVN